MLPQVKYIFSDKVEPGKTKVVVVPVKDRNGPEFPKTYKLLSAITYGIPIVNFNCKFSISYQIRGH
jgi:hypothetical protein